MGTSIPDQGVYTMYIDTYIHTYIHIDMHRHAEQDTDIHTYIGNINTTYTQTYVHRTLRTRYKYKSV